MKAQFYLQLVHSPVLVLPIVALFIFIGVFTVVTVRTFTKRKSTYDELARLVFESENGERP